MKGSSEQIDGVDLFIVVVLIAMIVLSPIAMGAVAGCARGLLLGACLLLVAAWLLRGAVRGELRVVRSPVWLCAAAFLAVVLVQLLPLSPSILKAVSFTCRCGAMVTGCE